ncbi:MAG: RNA methyltransferase [Monoglobales bacterium]
MITSASNPLIKHIKKLQTKKSYRRESGEFVIEGLRQVFDAKNSLKTVLISEDFKEKLPDFPCAVEIVAPQLMTAMSDTKNPQGILAVADMNLADEKDIIKEKGLYIFCDGIKDPGNLGTIIRTADSAGCDGVILSPDCVDLYNPKVVRATMSSMFNLPICVSEDSIKTLNSFKNNGVSIICTTPHTDSLIYSVDFKKSAMIILGNEANGVSDELLTMADACVKIPMVGHAESLNVATAGAVLIYEAVRQRTV